LSLLLVDACADYFGLASGAKGECWVERGGANLCKKMSASVFRERYAALAEFLESSKSDLASKTQSTAMQRIARLPSEQFFDVSSDLHDELNRRLYNPECTMH
jgi:hypothetical protein